jgi:PAS domain S-box-containing protein
MDQTAAPDFRRIFESAPGCYLILAPDLTIVAVSDAYLRATMTTREGIVGRGLFDVFPDNPDDPEATGVANLRASLGRVLANLRPDTMAVQKYDIRRPESEGGGFEERHWSPVSTPVLGDGGEVLYIIHRVEDATEIVRLKRQRTEQETAFRDLERHSQERYAELLDAAPDAMVVAGEDGTITLVNRQTELLFGYARTEMVGKSVDLLIPEPLRRGHARHVRDFFASPRTRSMGSGLDLFGQRKDGTRIPIEVSLSPLRRGEEWSVSAAIRDISERRQMEAAAKLAADRLQSAVESIEDAFVLFDAEDRLVQCNSAYRRLLGDAVTGPLAGRTYEEILDAWSKDFASSNDEESARFKERRMAERGQSVAVFEMRTRDGRSLRIMDRRTPEGGMVTTTWDLTEHVRREDELREARAAADVASAAKSEFLSSMSHELRTPLNAILGFAQLLQRDKKEPLPERHKGRVEQILIGGEHLLRLIDDVLDLARIEAGRVSISTEPVGVEEVLEQVKTTLRPAADRAGVPIDIAPMPAGAATILADRTRFSQILMNYGSNAIKYNRPEGSVTFVVSRPSPERLRVTVADTGSGIPLDKQHKLFQPFQRAGQETGPIEGTGIGLAISKRLAELMRGSVGFRSVPSEGSEFWVELPLHVPASAPDEASAGVETARLHGERRGVIVYVEDNPANVTFMRDLLGSFEGIELVTAPSAELGVELALSRQPDAIIMDINLPGMSGLDALHALRQHPKTKDIPVIALTAAASERDRQRGEQAGFYRYLTKPVNVAELEAALEALLSPGDRAS